jgi:hypothetical protein
VVFNKEVEFKDHITVDSDTAGSAIIISGAISTKVEFSRPYEITPRIVANLLSSGTPVFLSYLIFDKSTSSFSILLANPAPSDLYFDWMALAATERVGQVAGAVETPVVETPASSEVPSSTEPITIVTSSVPEIIPPIETEPIVEPTSKIETEVSENSEPTPELENQPEALIELETIPAQ